MWTRLAAGISDEQRKKLVEDAAKALQHLPLEELRDRNKLALKSQQQLSQLVTNLGVVVQAEEMNLLVQQVVARLGGLGFFHDLLPPQRTDLNEIAVTPNGAVWILKKGAPRFEKLSIHPSREETWRGVEALLAPLGRGVSEATPSVDAKLPRTEKFSGARIKVLHPCIVPGEGYPSVNIRLYEAKPVSPEQLIAWGMAPEAVIRGLVEIVSRTARVLIIGGTATGKTTFLSGISAGIPREERIVKIEDPEEIWIDRKTVQTVEARPRIPGSEVPAYTLADGVDDAMRMSPDYLIVGEVRDGRAAMALLRALMTGHAGACTLHADSPREAFDRLSTLMGSDMGVAPRDAARMIAASVDLLVQINIVEEARRVTSIARVDKKLHGGEAWFVPLWRCEESPDGTRWKNVAGNLPGDPSRDERAGE